MPGAAEQVIDIVDNGAGVLTMGTPAPARALLSGTFTSFSAAFGGADLGIPPNDEVNRARELNERARTLAYKLCGIVRNEPNFEVVEYGFDAMGQLLFRIRNASFGSGNLFFSGDGPPHTLLRVSGFGDASANQVAFDRLSFFIACYAARDREEPLFNVFVARGS
jgi:hypothetical protein